MTDNNFVTDIQMKANIFNNVFAEQCTPLKNSSVLPANQIFNIIWTKFYKFQRRRNPQDYKRAKYEQGARS